MTGVIDATHIIVIIIKYCYYHYYHYPYYSNNRNNIYIVVIIMHLKHEKLLKTTWQGRVLLLLSHCQLMTASAKVSH